MTATVVAAVGALALLAAAGTFLAVSWDTLPVVVRVAVVGAVTAAAIAGGVSLRRRLPAVGTVVFHFGVLLLPIDALGLALQLDASPAATWTAVGLTTVLALPVAATALAGAVAGRVAVRGPLAAAARGAAPVLATIATAGPLVVAVLVASLEAGAPLRVAMAAGWLPGRWTDAALAGAVATAAIVVATWWARSTRVAALVPVVAVLATVGTLLPGDAPRLATLLPWPLLFLAVEVCARLLRDDRLLAGPVAATATVTECLAAPTVLLALLATVTDPAAVADLDLAAVAVLGALAWGLASSRHRPECPTGTLAAVAAACAAAAAASLAVPALPLGRVVLLSAAALSLAGPARGLSGMLVTASGIGLGSAAIATAGVHTDVGTLLAGGGVAVGLAALPAVIAAIVVLLATLRLDAHARAGADPLGAALALLPVVLLATGATASATADLAGPAVTGLVAVAVLAAAAALVEAHRDPAIVLHVMVGVTAGLLIGAEEPRLLEGAVLAAPAATVAAVGLAVAVWRSGRVVLAILAGPVAVRAVAGVTWAVTGDEVVTGVVLLGVALAAAAVACGARSLRTAAATTATVAAVAGLALLSVTPRAAAWALLVLGSTAAAAGVVRRAPLPLHVGAIAATAGAWWLLSLEGITATDAWVAPSALHLWVSVVDARRAGRMSSWTADVPPLVLVVVPAVLERLTGGTGWHAVLAGGLGLVAVVGGGVGRHGGPLLVGAGTVSVVVLVETLAVVAAVPTWAWLTLGGATLLVVAAAIERMGGEPVRTARRVRDVVADRFD